MSRFFSIFFLGSRAQRRCDGCLDTLLKSFFQVFNPNVEAGPARLVSRHPYKDNIMPDFSMSIGGTDPDDDYALKIENCVPTADYVDNDVCKEDSGQLRVANNDDGHIIAKSKDDHPLTDFIISLLETIQLTSRATLKRSKNKRTADAHYSASPPFAKITRQSLPLKIVI